MSKKIIPPSTISLPPELIEHLSNLLEFSPPAAFRKSLLEIYLHYIITEYDSLPSNFESIASDFYMLVDFFTKAEELVESGK